MTRAVDRAVGEGGLLRGHCPSCEFTVYRKTTAGDTGCPQCQKQMVWMWGRLRVFWVSQSMNDRNDVTDVLAEAVDLLGH